LQKYPIPPYTTFTYPNIDFTSHAQHAPNPSRPAKRVAEAADKRSVSVSYATKLSKVYSCGAQVAVMEDTLITLWNGLVVIMAISYENFVRRDAATGVI
jgi:hypothetical protein